VGPRRRGRRLNLAARAALAALTGRPDGPPLLPAAAVLDRIGALGAPLGIDPLPLLTERAPLLGLRRGGTTSCGGATRLLRAADGWVALALARDSDRELLPALLGVIGADEGAGGDPVDAVAATGVADLRAGATLLGLPLAVLGEVPAPVEPVTATLRGTGPPLGRPPVVVDFSSLWAGPLCSRLLLERGATVVKVESRDRPDGARATAAFFDAMNRGKQQVAIEPEQFAAFLAEADVVIEGSRPRAFEQLGIDASSFPGTWVSITGYGRGPAERDRVAFGDDAAVAGGLVVRDEQGPCFLGDAIADPLTGVAAAAAVVAALEAGGAWTLDAALARTAAWVGGPIS
jgi:CoA-transferase family III